MSKKRLTPYRKGVLKGIRIAQSSWPRGLSSRTDALRGIRRFEEVNGVSFDYYNKSHREKISGSGLHEQFFRRMKRLLCAKA